MCTYKLGNENVGGIFLFFFSVFFLFFFFYVIKCVQMSRDDLFWYLMVNIGGEIFSRVEYRNILFVRLFCFVC